MAESSGGKLLARCLANEGIQFLFGLPSPEIDPLLVELEGEGIRLVPFRHEAAGAHMAEAVYKTTGRPAAVLGNPGPGSANLLAGVITARHEGVPLLAITSQHHLGNVYPSPPSTFQGQDQLDVYRPAVKWGAPILSRARIPEVVRLAFREMWTGRPGPVHIELPAPVVYEMADDGDAPLPPPSSYRAEAPQASAAQVEAIAEMLSGAERRLVIVGHGADRSGGRDAAVAIARRLGCPILSSMSARCAVPLDHPNRVYGIGAGGDAAKRSADVVLVAGSRLGNLDLPYDKYWGDPSKQKLIQIDVDPRHIGVTRPIAMGVVADAGATLHAVDAALAARGAGACDPAFLAECRKAGQDWEDEQMAVAREWKGPGLHPAHAMQAIGRAFGSEAIYSADGGNTSLWAYWNLPSTRSCSYLNILELGMLGTGVPYAVGAKLANPDREVVCVSGDGAAGFHFMEMQSAAREGLKLTTVVFAEGSWTMEEPNEQMLYGRTFGTKMGAVRWDKVAEGLGCLGLVADDLAGLEAALDKARAHDGPSVICVHTDHMANLAVPQDALLRFTEVYNGPM
jgi:acetolactate synthase-1/2/3 large subunit